LDLGAFQRPEELSAESKRHQFGGGKAERRDVAKTLDQTPACLAVMTLGYDGKAYRLECLQVPPDRAGVFREVFRDGFDELGKGQADRTLEPPQQVPLAGDLIVARHDCRLSYSLDKWARNRRPGRERGC
jgi:hypothetical protein